MNDTFRVQFPILKRKIKSQLCTFLDGPAGTQVPEYVIRAISQYYRRSNANTHGAFATTQETDKVVMDTRNAVATFLGAENGDNISFGQNMTTLNFSLARAIGKILVPGDEVLITQLDHESNREPWITLRDEGIIVREVKMKNNGTLDYNDFADKINDCTRLVCMGMASNISGAVNDVSLIRKLTYDVGAWLLLDAVHYAPHFKINVGEIGCDFLICSAYKFYGPHVGLLYTKTGLLDKLPTDRLRTSYQHAPYSIETGTLNHAALAGVNAAVQFIAKQSDKKELGPGLDDAMSKIAKHEGKLAKMLYKGLKAIDDISVFGPGFKNGRRAPTLSFSHKKYSAQEICERLAQHNIFVWGGHFYAIRSMEVTGLLENGGVTRMGISAYTSEEEVQKTLDVLSSI